MPKASANPESKEAWLHAEYKRDLAKLEEERPNRELLAFALGGLGGFNAHNAGFLQAVLDCERDKELQPAIITCTSGAIWWVYRYLEAKHSSTPKQLLLELEEQVKKCQGLNALQIAAMGDPGIFRPASAEYFARWMEPWPLHAMSWAGGLSSPAAEELFDRMCPAKGWVPERTDADYTAIAEAFTRNDSPGIMFNAYDLNSGVETVYCNERALQLTGLHPDSCRTRHDNRLYHLRNGRRLTPVAGGGGSHPIAYEVIRNQDKQSLQKAGDAVKSALWLLWYGVGGQHWQIDGAYHRQLILSELNACSTVYAVKPQPNQLREAPKNFFAVSDLQTEMWFNSAYASEVAELSYWAHKEGHRPANIVPITMKHQMGYFNYFVEKLQVFDNAYKEARAAFQLRCELP